MTLVSRRAFVTAMAEVAGACTASRALSQKRGLLRTPVLKLDVFPQVKASLDDVRIVRLSSGRVIHRFFDTSPISPSGRYAALFRFPREDRGPLPGEAGDVVLVDLKTGIERVVAQSRGYEMQLGAQVQWGASDNDLFFNDVDPKTWQAFAVHCTPSSGALRRLGGTVFMVSHDGTTLATYNLIASRYAQAGYGVIVPKAVTSRNFGPVDTDGLNLIDVASGRSHQIVTIRQLYEKATPSLRIPNPDEFEFYCFQVKWNPQGTRLLTTLQWSPRTDRNASSYAGQGRARAVITMRPDGSELRTAITPEQWAPGGHHVNWMADGEHLSMNLVAPGYAGLSVVRVHADGSGFTRLFTPGSGHPSQRPDGSPQFITDAYPDEPLAAHNGTSPLRLLDTVHGTEQTVVPIFVSMAGGELRIDPHPAWDRTGRYVVFNGFVGGTRNVYLMDLGKH